MAASPRTFSMTLMLEFDDSTGFRIRTLGIERFAASN
jgi:hypothetical protein